MLQKLKRPGGLRALEIVEQYNIYNSFSNKWRIKYINGAIDGTDCIVLSHMKISSC